MTDKLLCKAEKWLKDLTETACQAAGPASRQFPDRVRIGLETLLLGLAAEPEQARVAIVEVQALDSPHHRPYQRMVGLLTGLLESAAEGGGLEQPPPASTARAVTGGLLAVVCREIDGRRCETLPRLHPELVFLALIPYVGSEVAAEQMHRAREDGNKAAQL